MTLKALQAQGISRKRPVGRPRKNPPSHATAIATAAKSMTAKYDAGGTGKRMAGWNPPATGPNKATVGFEKIRNRARDTRRNDWTGESAVQKWGTTLVGIGIRPRLKRIKSKERKEALTDLWDDFVQRSDADGVVNFYGQQTMAVCTWVGDGEVFARRRPRKLDAGYPVPVQVQLLEGDYCPQSFDADTWPGLPTGNRIRQGIELDRSGQRVAYWMYREHPGDGMSGVIDAGRLLRIPASEVLHIYMPNRPGALRGVSLLAPILPQLRDIGNYRDSVLLRQSLANLFVAFLTRKLGSEDDENDPITGKPIGGSFDSPLMPLSPGLIQELEDGQDVKFANPPEAGTTYSDYLRTELLGPAAASGIPYEVFSGDIKDISDRTLRVLINEFRRLAEQRQWQVVIPMLCQPVRNWWTEAGVLAGLIAPEEADAARRVEWAPHGWAHIHPVQDPQGKKIEVDAGFRSRSSVVGERGDDPEAVDDERQQDDQREQDLEIGAYSAGVKAAGPVAQAKFALVSKTLSTLGIVPDHAHSEQARRPPSPGPTALEQMQLAEAQAKRDTALAQLEQARRTPAPPPGPTALEQEQAALTRKIVGLLGDPPPAE